MLKQDRRAPDEFHVILTVIWFLGGSLVVSLLGQFVLAAFKLPAPEGMSTIIGGLAGALGAMLANTRRPAMIAPTDVATGKPDDPVSVEVTPADTPTLPDPTTAN